MIESLMANTALPNLHPAVVHLPVALLPVGLLFDLICLAARRQVWLDRAAASLYLLGWVGAAAAYLTGDSAGDAARGLSGAAQVALSNHGDSALLTLIAVSVIAPLRLLVALRDRYRQAVPLGWLRLAVLVLAVAGQLLLLRTADLGGALVYRHGVAVQATRT